MSFVHLHVHSQYSLLEAACRPKAMAKAAAEMGMPAVAMTDNGNMFGAVEFYFAAKDAGVKSIAGMDAYLAPKSRLIKGEDRETSMKPPTRLVLLAQNHSGYQTLCQLSTIGFQEGFYYKPRIDHEVLKKFNKDVIALSGGIDGEVAMIFLQKGPEAALEAVRNLQAIFGDRFYLELNRTGRPEWEGINTFLLEASRITGVPCVATNDVHYMVPEESQAQEVLYCIGANKTLQDQERKRLGGDQFYFKNSEQMNLLFKDIPGVCERTLEVADRCNLEFKFKDDQGRMIYHLPSYPVKHGKDLVEEMKELTLKGLEERFVEAKGRDEVVPEGEKPDYFKRLDYELSVIAEMGFNGYFLIVQDFISWAKDHDIPVGPGRGSGAGSLVAYTLGITDLDPLRHKLIFERFLNPERVSMPDFDIDFCQDRRQEVIEYVSEKYGRPSVSQIITFGKLKAKAALRDVGRVLGMTFAEVDVIAKLIPDKLNITLEEAIDEEPELADLIEDDPSIATMLDLARKVEGLTRHASIHAAGVIISDRPLVEHAPLYKGVDGENVVQYDMKMSEKIGLIKFDFLGLKTLTLIHHALKLVEKNTGKKIPTSEIPMNDPEIYSIMSRGDTLGIFQFEGEGISELIRKVQPTSFGDITAINALYRPGPMQMLDEYIGRKHGRIKVKYLFDELEEVLKETYGIIVYQEQVQLIAAKIASYSLGEADMLRRAMGKKIASEMEQQKGRFLEGAEKNNFDKKKATELFDLMAKFAEYGFNKSHAAAYCVVAAQTAWLKAHYPVEFYAALLSTEMGDTDKVVGYIKDVRRHDIEVQPPNVSYSEHKFTATDKKVFFGLGAIKGVGQAAVEAILEAREELPGKRYESLEQFFEVVDLRRVNKRVIECLIKAGAFDGFGYNRAELMLGFPRLIDASEIKREEQEVGQVSLFSIACEDEVRVQIERRDDWNKTVKLSHEKQVLGFYLSDHPLNGMERILKPWVTCELSGLSEVPNKQSVWVGGIIGTCKEYITKKGTKMAFATLEDKSNSVELVIFPEPFKEFSALLGAEVPLLVEGVLKNEDGTLKILAERLVTLDSKMKTSKTIIFNLDSQKENDLKKLKALLARFPGATGVELDIYLRDQKRNIQVGIDEPSGIEPSRAFLEDVEKDFGDTAFVSLRT